MGYVIMTANGAAKECAKCGVLKPVSAYRIRYDRKRGYHSRCRQCENAQQRAGRERNPNQAKQWRTENRERARAWKREYQREYRANGYIGTRRRNKRGNDNEDISTDSSAYCERRTPGPTESFEYRGHALDYSPGYTPGDA